MAGSRRRAPDLRNGDPWWHAFTSDDAGHLAGRLALTLAHVCGQHDRAPGAGGDPLRPGSKVAIMPTGEYCTYSQGGQPDPSEIALCTRAFRAPPAGGAGPPGGGDGPPCALRLRFLHLPRPAEVAICLFRHPKLTLHGYALRTKKIAIPRGVLDAGGMGLARGVLRIVREDERRVCLEELGRMEPRGRLPDERPPRLEGLLGLLEAANASRPIESLLGTVLLAPESLRRLAGGGGDAAGRWEVRTHASVPTGAAYAVASARGPVLARGPTAIDCETDAFLVRHYCVAVGGHGGVRVDLPWGARPG